METSERPEPVDTLRILERNLAGVREAIRAACARAGRPPGSAELLPVVKSVGAGTVALLHRLGVREAAEGTVQGAIEKSGALAALDIRWHLVGHLQRNKARKAAGLFDGIQSLDSLRLAARLDEEIALLEAGSSPVDAGAGPGAPGPRLSSLFVEVHNGVDATKAGIPQEEVAAFLREMRGLPRVAARIAGLMVMAPYAEDPEAARPTFRRVRDLRDRLVSEGLLPEGAGLSMGMSGDFPVAVEEGATVVRVGTRLFEGLPEPAPPGGGGTCP